MNVLLLSVSMFALGCGLAAAQGAGFLIEGAPAAPLRPAIVAPNTIGVAPPPRVAATRPVLGPVALEGEGPDETALRYYAGQNQTERVAVESARLNRLYPDWRPPENLYESISASGEDEQALWDLFGADKMDDLHQAIALRQRDEPAWKPSAELTDKIARKTLRLKLVAMWKEGRLADVLEAVRAEGYGGDLADVDLRWTVAEVYARMKQTAGAVDVYKGILNTAPLAADRLATIQKAMDVLRITDVEPLIAMGRVNGAGLSEFSPLAVDITRARISAFLHDERAEPIPPAEFALFEAYARGVNEADQAGLVAWHHYKTRSFREALDWFKLALDRGGDAMVAHGLAHSLRELGMRLEAEEVAYAWREPLINNAVLFIDVLERDLTKPTPPPIETGRLLRYGQVTMDLASGEGAQALGWYAYNTCQYEVAYEWFLRAAAWYPKEATVYGLALSARRLKKQKELFELANRYDGLFPKALDILFPDGFQRPPSACDLMASGGAAGVRKGAPAAPMQTSLWEAAGATGASSARHPGWGGAAAPQTSGHGQPTGFSAPLTPAQNDKLPQFSRTEFPAAVDPENPLRFASTGKTIGRAAAVRYVTVQNTPMLAEPWRNPQPLVASRVPGVSSMPYERWGFALLAGGNGLQNPDAPHSALQAPAGTLWATEQASGTGANQVGGAGVQNDPYAQLQAIAASSKAPPPSAVRAAAGQGFMRSSSLDGEQSDPLLTPTELRPSFAATEADFAPTGSTDPVELPGAALPLAPQQVEPQIADPPGLDRETRAPQEPAGPAADEDAAAQTTTQSRAQPDQDDLRATAMRLYEGRQYQAVLDALDRRAGANAESFDLRIVRGWARAKLKLEQPGGPVARLGLQGAIDGLEEASPAPITETDLSTSARSR